MERGKQLDLGKVDYPLCVHSSYSSCCDSFFLSPVVEIFY